MDSIFDIYINVLGNFIDVFLFLRFTKANLKQKLLLIHKFILLSIYFVYSISIFANIPFYISIIIDFLFLVVIARPNFKNALFILVKFQAFSYISTFAIFFSYSIVFSIPVIFSF